MIKYFVFSLFFIGYLNSITGQSHFVQTGFNKSNVSWRNTVQHNYNYDYNYFAGYSFEMPLSKSFNFNAGFLFSQKGFVDRAPNNREVRKETYEYIDIIPTISFLPHRSFGYFIGGNMGFLFREEDEIAHNLLDFGLIMGFEYNIKKVKIRASYNHGISSIFDESKNQSLVDNDITPFNSNFQLSFGYQFYGNSSSKKISNSDAESSTHKLTEVGISLYSLNSFNAVVKTQRSEKQYVRYTLGLSNFNIRRTRKFDLGWNLVFNAGLENRKSLSDHIDFIHGLEPGFNISYSSNSEDFNINLRPSIGYVIGVYYKNNGEKFRLGFETTPSLFVNFDFDEQGVVNEWNAGLNMSSRVRIVVTYSFSR